MDRTTAFYAAIGFDVANRDGSYLVLHDGPVELHFAQLPDSSPGQCSIRVDDATALWKRLKQEGAEGIGPVADMQWGLREFTVTDADGNWVRFGSSLD